MLNYKIILFPFVPFKKMIYDILTDKANLPGYEFKIAGERLGKKLLLKRIFSPRLLFNPVSIVRYFEYDFINKNIGDLNGKNIIDVSSPFLFGFFVATQNEVNYNYINADKKDLARVKQLSKNLDFKGHFNASLGNALSLPAGENSIDRIVSISVIEHISENGDSEFIKEALRVLKPGGFLILTFPVSKEFEIQYRDKDIYGLNHEKINNKYFFQRVYDQANMDKRILSPGKSFEIYQMRIFGEKENGFYTDYQKRWLKYGLFETVKDPYYISKHFKYYESISELPGIGVIGLALRKKKNEI